MNPIIMKVIKAIVGLVVLTLLLLMVLGWWKDFRAARSDTASISSADVTATADGKGTEKPAESSPADKSNAQADTVVILVDGVNLKQSAKRTSKTIRGLNKNEELVLLKKTTDWYQVKTAEGDTGWVTTNPRYTKIQQR